MSKRFDKVVEIDPSKIRTHKQQESEKDRNYTVPALVALFGIVLVTALFFAQPQSASNVQSSDANANLGGQAYAGLDEQTSVDSCDVSSWCDGSRLIRQHSDCRQYIASCKYGCDIRPDGAVCR